MQQGPLTITSRPSHKAVPVQRSALIATLPRSGSWLLADALLRTGKVGQPGEFFRADYRGWFAREWDLPADHTMRAYVDAALERTSSDTGVFSAKLHWYQFEWLVRNLNGSAPSEGIAWTGQAAAAFPRPTFIYLFRLDKARQALSYYRAATTQQWFESANGSPRPDGTAETIDLQQVRYLEGALTRQERLWERFFERSAIDPLRVCYEEFVSAYPFTVVRILDALGIAARVEEVATAPAVRRQSDAGTELWLERYRAARDDLEPFGPDLVWSPEQVGYVRGRVGTSNGQGRSPSVTEESAPPQGERQRGLPDAWRQWIASMKLRGQPDDRIVAILTEHGIDGEEARAELAEAGHHPYLRAANDLSQQLRKLESVFEVSRTVSAAGADSLALDQRPLMDHDEFVDQYYSRGRPVLLSGVADAWPARLWTLDSLREACGETEVEIMAGRDDDPDYEVRCAAHKTRIPMSSYIERIAGLDESNDVYMVANNHFFETDAGQALIRDLDPLPPFLLPDQEGTHTFLWLGPKGTVTPLHHDVVNVLFVQLVGRKRFLIAPPDHTPLVYNRRGVFGDVDPEQVDYEQFPRFRDARMREVWMSPGDALFLPVGWWHHVRSMDTSISVSFTNFRVPNGYNYFSPNAP